MRRTKLLCNAVAAVTAGLISEGALAAAPEFQILDIGVLSGGTFSEAWGINNSGQVVGRARNTLGSSRAFITSPNSPLNEATDLLPLLSGGAYNFARQVNSSGQVAAYGGSTSGDRAIRYTAGVGTVINPAATDPNVTPFAVSFAEGINNSGQVVGNSTANSGYNVAFLYSGTTLVSLPLLTAGSNNGEESYATAINTNGKVVGFAAYKMNPYPVYHAFIWTPNVNNGTTGTILELGTFGGDYSYGFDINDSGHIVGQAFFSGDTVGHAFLRTTGALIDLGTLGGTNSAARAINESGHIVGDSDTAGGQRGFIYLDGAMYDLNSLLPAGHGWTITDVRGLNDSMQIVGFGTNPSGETHGYLMSALPTWKVNSNGNWSTAANWFVGSPSGAGKQVRFTNAITTPRTITLDVAATVGQVAFQNLNRYTISGSQTLTFSGGPGSTGVHVRTGSHTIATPMNFLDNSGINLEDNTGLKLSGAVSGKVKHVSLGSGAQLDLVSNKFIIDYDGTSPLGSISAALKTGLNNGGWDGPGIVSSTAAADVTNATAIGFGEESVLGLGSFNGESVDGTSLLFKYTYFGDANLDGVVNKADLRNIALGWHSSGPWTSGDFNYDGRVDVLDLTLLAINWLAGLDAPLGEPLLAEALQEVGLPSVVPEPAGLLGAFGAGMLLIRRRRRD